MSETETGSDTESWKQLLRPTRRQDLLTLSLTEARARQVAGSPEERTRRLLEDIETGIQKRLDQWCPGRTQDIRRPRKNVLRALRKRREKQTGPRQYTYPEIMRLVQARIQRTLDNTSNITHSRPMVYAPRRKNP